MLASPSPDANLARVANASSWGVLVCSLCFAPCAKNVLWYVSAVFSQIAGSALWKQHTGSQVNQLGLWPHWHTYYCLFCFSLPLLGLFSFFLQDWASVTVSWCIMGRGNRGSIRWSANFSQTAVHLGFSHSWLNKGTTDIWTEAAASRLYLVLVS